MVFKIQLLWNPWQFFVDLYFLPHDVTVTLLQLLKRDVGGKLSESLSTMWCLVHPFPCKYRMFSAVVPNSPNLELSVNGPGGGESGFSEGRGRQLQVRISVCWSRVQFCRLLSRWHPDTKQDKPHLCVTVQPRGARLLLPLVFVVALQSWRKGECFAVCLCQLACFGLCLVGLFSHLHSNLKFFGVLLMFELQYEEGWLPSCPF